MLVLLSRNRVEDFDRWKAVFDEQLRTRPDSGLRPLDIWQSVDDPNDVFFTFEVTDEAKAKAYLVAPESAAAGEASGVLDGAYWFVESVD